MTALEQQEVDQEQATAPAVDPQDPRPFWEGYEFKRYVVTVEAGPYKRKKPAFKTVMIIRAKTGVEAKSIARGQLVHKVRRPSFSARLAHPVHDLGLTKCESFDPVDAAVSAIPHDSWGIWCITCKCGHRADVEAFTLSPSGVELGPRSYQCPKCFRAWRVEILSPAWMAENGYVVPARLGCVPALPTV